MDGEDQHGALGVIGEIHLGLLQLVDSEQGVHLWLGAPHPALDGAPPQQLIDAGKGTVVLTLVRHMFAGAPARFQSVHLLPCMLAGQLQQELFVTVTG